MKFWLGWGRTTQPEKKTGFVGLEVGLVVVTEERASELKPRKRGSQGVCGGVRGGWGPSLSQPASCGSREGSVSSSIRGLHTRFPRDC